MNRTIESFITRKYYELLNIAKKITKTDEETSRELLHEVILQLYQRDEIVLKSYEDEQLFQLLEEQYCELDWFRKSLLDLYLSLNSLKAVSRKTTIPLTSISRYIKEGKEQIKANVITKLNRYD
jgi:hypothetical protein